MSAEPTLKEKQFAWAVAWQDHGDRQALSHLCNSVEPYVKKRVRRGRTADVREELLCAYRLAVVEAAKNFDRERPEGFFTLCALNMLRKEMRVFQHANSPASMNEKVWAPARRVAIATEEDENDSERREVARLTAAQPFNSGEKERKFLDLLIDSSGLNARERRVIQAWLNEEIKKELAELWGCSPQNILNYEKSAFKKIRLAAQVRGLSLEDLL